MEDVEVRAVQQIKTGIKTVKERLEWVLDRQILESALESRLERTYLTSPKYAIQLNNDTTFWEIRLKIETPVKDYMSIFLKSCNDKNSKKIEVGFKFSIKTQDGKLTMPRGFSHKRKISEMLDGRGFVEYIKIVELGELYVNDKLSIVCDLIFTIEKSEHIRNDIDEQVQYNTQECETKFVEHMKNLYSFGSFSDLVIFCGDQKYLCHKIVLASRSDVFKEMLEDDKQKIIGELEITDNSPDSFRLILDHIYTGKIPHNIENVATELFSMATKYNLQALATACEISLLGQLTDANALETLITMHKHMSSESSKNDVIKYIVINAKEIIDTEKFKEFSKQQTELMIEIFRYAAIKQNTEVLSTVKAEGTVE